MIRSSVAVFTTGLMAFTLTAAQAADLSFATPDGVFRMEPAGGDRQTLLPEGDRTLTDLAWSSDGQQLAVVQNYSEVYRIEPGAEAPQLVFTSSCPRSPSLELLWQRDRDTLVIKQRCPTPIPGELGQIDLFLSTASGTVTPLDILPAALESDLYLSPDGSQVAYVTGQHIFVAALDGGRPRRITQTPGTYAAAGSPLAWSPDGTHLAFYEGSYPLQRLNVVSADGGDRRLLTPDPNFQIYRSRILWSPDSRYIAFYKPFNPPFSNQEVISLVNINTGETQMVTRPGFYDALSWAPDSQQLVFASGAQAGQQTLFRLNLVDQDFTALTTQPLQNVLDSQWSPTGDWIAFTATPPDDPMGSQVLYRVHPDGSQLAPLTGIDEYVYPFVWVPASLATQPGGLSEAP
ncbi:TolB family protein [Nodosilinea nodulosa]|uniref:TolB family protein n=1 Tax=Nodosilinea nodulosa TaxID=416001 RepID=UPI00030B00FD|nr:LpqB family beta-propeller domain-containing protein [Nodosilinea nodulosa]